MTNSLSLSNLIEEVSAAGRLRPDAAANMKAFLAAGLPRWAGESVEELVKKEAWSELNDRFYRDLEFGTGGMRGRTIGAISTAAEVGVSAPGFAPVHAAVGSNMMNDFTVVRAVVGLYRYTRGFLDGNGDRTPAGLVIAHDVRYFSRAFCELAASTWVRLGGRAWIFDGPRPTPQLSYSVRWLKAHAGVVITASHNPPHDNGFKAYFGDGAQVIAPHDVGIVAQVGAVPLGELGRFLATDLSSVVTLGRDADDAYLAAASAAALDPKLIRTEAPKVVYTNIHGTGAVHAPTLLIHAGCNVVEVQEQLSFDPRFSTVKSPNPWRT